MGITPVTAKKERGFRFVSALPGWLIFSTLAILTQSGVCRV
jgi:hypothetical protein